MKRNNLKKYILSAIMLIVFETVAITLWLTKNNIFYLFNFSYTASLSNAPAATPTSKSIGLKLGSGFAKAAPKLAKPPVSLSTISIPGARRKTVAILFTK